MRSPPTPTVEGWAEMNLRRESSTLSTLRPHWPPPSHSRTVPQTSKSPRHAPSSPTTHPDATAGEELVDGFDLLSLPEVDVTSIVSIHIDEVEVWEEAAKIGADGGHEAAEDHLGDSDLLWYDATELPELLRERELRPDADIAETERA